MDESLGKEASPAGPVDWGARYAKGDTPWDLGGPHPELVRRIAAGELAPPRGGGRAFVPGCGRGHDALRLARAGWTVLAVDLVGDLEAELAPRLARDGGRFLVADALGLDPGDFGGPFELVLEHTFFCALELDQRPAWGELMRRAVAPGGRLAALVFPVDKPREEGGPPHRSPTGDLAAALGREFRRAADKEVRARGPGRRWKERFALFERRDPSKAAESEP